LPASCCRIDSVTLTPRMAVIADIGTRLSARHAGDVIRRRKRCHATEEPAAKQRDSQTPYERAALRRTAIRFAARCLNFIAALLTASASVAASISPIHVCLEAI
jgi:hypothetical protein